MTKTYFPLWTYGQPPIPSFQNGVEIATRTQVGPVSVKGWEEALTGREIRDLQTWHWALLHKSDLDTGSHTQKPPEQLLADCHVALQVLDPQGNFTSFCVREEGELRSSVITRFERFNGTAWSRMSSIGSKPSPNAQTIVDGIIDILESGNARIINPLRLFEHAMTSTNPYIRILLWITALDGVLMAVTMDNFVDRLCGLLGADHLVFPAIKDSSIRRDMQVKDLAKDLFLLRSQIAHGSAIGKKFWEIRPDLSDAMPAHIYGDQPRYLQLLEEAALSIFSIALQKIVTEGSLAKYRHVATWRDYLKAL